MFSNLRYNKIRNPKLHQFANNAILTLMIMRDSVFVYYANTDTVRNASRTILRNLNKSDVLLKNIISQSKLIPQLKMLKSILILEIKTTILLLNLSKKRDKLKVN